MAQRHTAPFGAWQSPISTALITADTVGLADPRSDGDQRYWLESRPDEGGRTVLVHHDGDRYQDVMPREFNVRTRVHEYGGGAWIVDQDIVYFSHFVDQGLYRQLPEAEPLPLMVVAGLRFADYQVDRHHQQLIAISEDHRQGGKPSNSLVAIPLHGSAPEPVTLAEGADFYAAPALSPDGRWLAWLAWNHPTMPWDSTELWLGELDEHGHLCDARQISGSLVESVLQPRWSPDGVLHFVSDRSGWWNLYRYRDGDIEAIWSLAAEFAVPPWQFGLDTYAFDQRGILHAAYTQDGRWHLARIDDDGGHRLDIPYDVISQLRPDPQGLMFIGGSATQPSAVVQLDTVSGQCQELRRASELSLDPGYLSHPEAISFSTGDGLNAHGIFYPPTNHDYQAPEGTLPPLLVKSHGGPTSSASPSFNLGIQYWTSRGFAVVDVNYGGSTGYGRGYHQRLDGLWGVVDVDDCINAARYLADQGRVDRERCAIRGGSAGGYTTLAALTFHDFFKAGASHYGVSDLESLAADTHKFESRYLDGLIGSYPEERERYRARSPIHHAEGLNAPVIFFQGLEDKIVPPNQAEDMVAVLRAKGVAVAYLPFPGEQHGFRQAANIQRALAAELYFYGRIFAFQPADTIDPVPIDNLSD